MAFASLRREVPLNEVLRQPSNRIGHQFGKRIRNQPPDRDETVAFRTQTDIVPESGKNTKQLSNRNEKTAHLLEKRLDRDAQLLPRQLLLLANIRPLVFQHAESKFC
jgi:hypothetical protein